MSAVIMLYQKYYRSIEKLPNARSLIFLIIAVIISAMFLKLICSMPEKNVSFRSIDQRNDATTIKSGKFQSAYIDSDGFLRSILSPNLRWCSANPFLKYYNQNVVLDLEIRWISWKRNQLFTTYNALKDYALRIGDYSGIIAHLVYPTSLPLPCPYKNNLTRIGGIQDGNKLLCGIEIFNLSSNCLVYSLGSLGNFYFEQDLLKRASCEIHTYDCTVSAPATPIKGITYHQICLGDRSSLQKFMYPYNNQSENAIFDNETLFKRFHTILKENGHKEVHILKMDIEGGEYSVFSDLFSQSNEINLPYQISFESHWWNRDIYHAILHQNMFSELWRSGYRILQHEHNPGDHGCIEWTLMRVFC